MPMDSGIRLHKQMAMTGKYPGEANNFGIMDQRDFRGMIHPDHDSKATVMKDSDRACGPATKERYERGMPAQADVDHGPHFHRDMDKDRG
jgi:hypothetical protein